MKKEKIGFSVTLLFDNFVSQEIDVAFIPEVIVSGATSLCTISLFGLPQKKEQTKTFSKELHNNLLLFVGVEEVFNIFADVRGKTGKTGN